jgi:hypothetical protein
MKLLRPGIRLDRVQRRNFKYAFMTQGLEVGRGKGNESSQAFKCIKGIHVLSFHKVNL